MYDSSVPKKFFCYPPQPAAAFGYIQWPYSSQPTAITDEGNSINLDNIYKEPLVQWVLYKSYLRDSKDAANKALALDARAEFYRLLGIKDQGENIEGAD